MKWFSQNIHCTHVTTMGSGISSTPTTSWGDAPPIPKMKRSTNEEPLTLWQQFFQPKYVSPIPEPASEKDWEEYAKFVENGFKK